MSTTMTPHGEFNPATIEPSDYPHRALIAGADANAATVIAWFDRDPLPFDDDFAEAMLAVFGSGGHVLLLAKDAALLDRIHAATLVIADKIDEGFKIP